MGTSLTRISPPATDATGALREVVALEFASGDRFITFGGKTGRGECEEVRYRGSLLIRNRPLLGPYSRTVPRVLLWFWGGGLFFMSEYGTHSSSTETVDPLERFVGKFSKNSHSANERLPGPQNREFLGSCSTNRSFSLNQRA